MSLDSRSYPMCMARTFRPAAFSWGAISAPNGPKVSTSSKPQAFTCASVPGTSFARLARRLYSCRPSGGFAPPAA